MGGMGGGMGGFNAIPDELSLNNKKTSSPDQAAAVTERVPAAANISAINLKPKSGQSLEEAWADYFAGLDIKTAEDIGLLDQRIRSTARLYTIRAGKAEAAGNKADAVEEFTRARDLISSAIRAGHVQAWMYHAYAIALKATAAPMEDVERAFLSAVDFAASPEEVLHVAARLEAIGANESAMRLCRDVSNFDPYRREPYVMGLRIAKTLDSIPDLTWACQGVLSQAWPENFKKVADEARLIARATHARLLEEGRRDDAAAFNAALQQAAAHDVVVRVSWTGNADIDLAIEEPSGTICSIDNLSTAGGGTLLADAYPGSTGDNKGKVSETYICPEGFTGQYRLLIRRVWGNVSTGNVTVELLTDVGRKSQRFIRKQIPLTEQDALVVFDVKEGQRQQEVADAQLAHLRDVRREVQDQVLGQMINGNSNGQVLQDLYNDITSLTNGAIDPARGFNRRRGAVGFKPDITVLPEGASMTGIAIISADRRFVRITPAPFFSQIGKVSTFNFITGEDAPGGAAGGAGGGAGGGGGGGIGGGGGGIGGGGGGGGAFN